MGPTFAKHNITEVENDLSVFLKGEEGAFLLGRIRKYTFQTSLGTVLDMM